MTDINQLPESQPLNLEGAEALERAIALAVDAHAGQVQKDASLPYILHPLSVMARVESLDEKIVAVLHDVVEDTDVTLDDLQAEGFADEVVVAVGLLSRQPGMSYEQFIEEIRPNPLARTVKIADIEDNSDIRRLPTFNASDAKRLERYHRAWLRLMQ